MPDSSGSIAAMLATFLHLLAQTPVEQAQEKTAAEEGRDIVLMMLLVGVIFVGFALIARPVELALAQAPQRASLVLADYSLTSYPGLVTASRRGPWFSSRVHRLTAPWLRPETSASGSRSSSAKGSCDGSP